MAVTEFLVSEKESVTKISEAVVSLYGVSAVDGNTDSRWASRIASSEKGHAELSDVRPSLWLANNSSQGLFHSKRHGLQPAACNWAGSIQGKCERQYRCLGICKSVCPFGYMKRNLLSQNCTFRGVFGLTLQLRG